MNMNGNPLLGQVLGGVFSQALGRRGVPGGGFGGGLGGAALGGILAGALGRRAGLGRGGVGVGRGGGNRSALLMMLLPFAMRWVQQNGGIGAVLERFRQRGMGTQAKSWISTGPNQVVDDAAIRDVVGDDELTQLAQRLGVPREEVASAFSEILPEMVNQLSPAGEVPAQADEVLDEGRQVLEHELAQHERDVPAPH